MGDDAARILPSSIILVTAQTGLSLGDIDLIELNETFAAQTLGCLKELEVTGCSNINVNGSGVSLGHPVGATGARIITTLLYAAEASWGVLCLKTVCIGGGQKVSVGSSTMRRVCKWSMRQFSFNVMRR